MAQKVTVELVDDLDGAVSDDIATISFALDGASYEIDLNVENANNLRKIFEDFIAAGRRTGGRVRRGPGSGKAERPAVDREQTRAIREWARQNGFEIAERGRIPTIVIESFEQAHAVASGKPRSRNSGPKVRELAFSG